MAFTWYLACYHAEPSVHDSFFFSQMKVAEVGEGRNTFKYFIFMIMAHNCNWCRKYVAHVACYDTTCSCMFNGHVSDCDPLFTDLSDFTPHYPTNTAVNSPEGFSSIPSPS